MVSKLRALREREGLTINDVAEMTGLSKTAINRIDAGDTSHKTNVDTAHALANGLYVNVDDLFDRLDITDVGRPALTGKPLSRKSRRQEDRKLCPSCFVLYSPHLGCETCGAVAPLTA